MQSKPLRVADPRSENKSGHHPALHLAYCTNIHRGETWEETMETYTWEVLPPELKARSVVEQLAAEYDWTLARLRERGLASR